MIAQMGNNPSYTWRSIIEGRTVLEKGLIWTSGNGANINIRDSPSIPNVQKLQSANER